jgi:hypothetical protein
MNDADLELSWRSMTINELDAELASLVAEREAIKRKIKRLIQERNRSVHLDYGADGKGWHSFKGTPLIPSPAHQLPVASS